MVSVQPVRDFVRDLAGKQILGQLRTAGEQEAVDGFITAFPDLQNPIFIRCDVDGHTKHGVLLFPDEMTADSAIGNIRFANGHGTCTDCGDAHAVVSERVNLISR